MMRKMSTPTTTTNMIPVNVIPLDSVEQSLFVCVSHCVLTRFEKEYQFRFNQINEFTWTTKCSWMISTDLSWNIVG
jgi:hypothetical protein